MVPESVPSTEIVKVLPEETTKLFSEVTSVAAPPLHPDTGVKKALILSFSPPSAITSFSNHSMIFLKPVG